MTIPVLYRDSQLIICEKPVGVLCESPGLPDLLQEQLHCKLFPVHRLDQGTGGICVLALSPASCTSVQKQFQSHCIRKEYLAVITGKPEENSGSFMDLLFHDRKLNKSFVVKQKRKGVRDALCDWSVIESTNYNGQQLSLVRVAIHTGRTHQIRVQFASRGMPLVGDRKYGSRIQAETPSLWACSIVFPHPAQKGRVISASSMPHPSFPWNLFSFSDL